MKLSTQVKPAMSREDERDELRRDIKHLQTQCDQNGCDDKRMDRGGTLGLLVREKELLFNILLAM
jgi:hypothetical protein